MGKKQIILLRMALLTIATTIMLFFFCGCQSSIFTGEVKIISSPVTAAVINISYSYQVQATGDPIIFFSLSKNPEGMTIDSSSGQISWIPQGIGEYQVVIIADNGVSSASQSFTITVTSQELPPRVVMMELFVAPTCPHCTSAKGFAKDLLEEYGLERLVVLEEYGWDWGEYTGWATVETIQRFRDYTDAVSISRMTPDTYINGLNQVVHGNQVSYNCYQAAIEAELGKPAKVAIEEASYTLENGIFTVSIIVENVSWEDLTNLAVGAMLYEDEVYLGSVSDKVNHVVRSILYSEKIEQLSANEKQNFTLASEVLSNINNVNRVHAVVFVQQNRSDFPGNISAQEILQAQYIQ